MNTKISIIQEQSKRLKFGIERKDRKIDPHPKTLPAIESEILDLRSEGVRIQGQIEQVNEEIYSREAEISDLRFELEEHQAIQADQFLHH